MENVIEKKNLRCLKLFCNCSNVLNLSDVTELLSRSGIHSDGF